MEKILEKINNAGLTLLMTLTPDETYSAVVEEAIKLVDAEYGSILLGSDEKLHRVYVSDPFFMHLKIRKGGTIEEAYKNKMLIVNNITNTTPVDPLIREKGIKSVILIPLIYRSVAIGVLSVLSLKKEHFTKKQVDMLRVYGSMASIAIKKAELYDETRKALEIRDMFISMAAHELRTPLTSISGYIQLLYSKLSKSKGPEAKWIVSLYEENKRMMHLVKEILEVQRLKAGQLQFKWQECELDKIIREGIKDTLIRFKGRKINYKNTLKEKSIIIGDSEKLIKAIDNILDNALKYSADNLYVDIEIEEKGKSFNIRIKDSGRGISQTDLATIFEGQHKGEGGEEGIGYGLYFVENIIRQHRGLINIKSKLDKGTTIELRLPKAKYSKS